MEPNITLPIAKTIITYLALISQSGTNIPQVTKVFHTFRNVTFAWTRTGVGFYILTASEPVFELDNCTFTWGLDKVGFLLGEYMSTTTYRVRSLDGSGAGTDGIMFNATVKIEVLNNI